MTYKKFNRVRKKSYHYNPSKRNSNKGIWNRLVQYHSKSCVKGDKNCKWKRFKNKCTSLTRKTKSEQPIELVVTKKINLHEINKDLESEVLPSNSDKKFDDLLELINTCSPIRSEQFGSKDRLYNSMGELILTTYTHQPRKFDTLNSNHTCFQTVVQKIKPNNSNDKNILKTFAKSAETPLHTYNKKNSVTHNCNRNDFCHRKKPNANSKVKNVNEIRPRKNNVSKLNKTRFVSPSTPPKKPIRGSTKAWELLEGYEKHCEKKQKETNWDHFKENTDAASPYPYFL